MVVFGFLASQRQDCSRLRSFCPSSGKGCSRWPIAVLQRHPILEGLQGEADKDQGNSEDQMALIEPCFTASHSDPLLRKWGTGNVNPCIAPVKSLLRNGVDELQWIAKQPKSLFPACSSRFVSENSLYFSLLQGI